MLDQKVLGIARSSIEVSFEERRSSFNEELSRKMRELQKSGNLPRESSRGAKIIRELCANELKSRAEIIWESLERAHESSGSQLNETLVGDLKEVVNHFIEEMAKEISTLMSKRSGLAKNEIKKWTLDSAKNLARKRANIEIDLYVNRLTQSSSGQKKGAKTIFISHAAEDAVLAETVKTQIDNVFEKKINVFVSSIPGKISPGSDWLDKIIGNLAENNAFIVLVTPYSEKRPFVWFEIGFSWLRRLNRNCEIYAICAPPIDPGNLPEPLCRLQATSLASEKQARAFFDKLTKQFNMGNLGTIEFIKIHNSLPTYPSQIGQREAADGADDSLYATYSPGELKQVLFDILLREKKYHRDPVTRSPIFDGRLIDYKEFDEKHRLPVGTGKKYLKEVGADKNFQLEVQFEDENTIRFKKKTEFII